MTSLNPTETSDGCSPATALPRPRPGVVHTDDGGDHFLVDTDGGQVFQINRTAARIFDLCAGRATYAAAVASLCADLSEPGQEDAVRADVARTVAQLRALGLCEALEPQ